MQINGQANAIQKTSQVLLAHNSCNHAGQNIPRSRRRHSWITRRIDVNPLIGSGDNRPEPLQDDIYLMIPSEVPSDFNSIRRDVINVFSNDPCHLSRVGCQDDVLSFTLDLLIETDKGVQSVSVENNRNRAFLDDAANKGAGFGKGG